MPQKKRSMTTHLVKIFVLLLACRSVTAQELSNLAGAFADLNLGVRPSAMGSAYTALSGDGNALLYNPAVTAFSGHASLTATMGRLYQIVPASFLGGHYPAGDLTWSAGLQQVGDDLLRESTFGVAAAMRADRLLPASWLVLPAMERMSFSASMRFLFTSFGNDDSGGEQRVRGDGRGVAVDLGYYFKLNGLRFGATLRDAVSWFRWNSSTRGNYVQTFPKKLRFGVAWVEPTLRFSLDYQAKFYEDRARRVHIGLEYNLTRWLVVRGGLAQNIDGRFQNKVFTAGFGVYSISWQKYRLAVQGGYRTDALSGSWRFALDFFWPGGAG